jgi:cytochrome c
LPSLSTSNVSKDQEQTQANATVSSKFELYSPKAGKNLMGTSLHGVFDRASGQARAFSYSAALQGARLQWN